MKIDLELDASAALDAASIPITAAAAERKGFAGVWGGEANNKDPIVLMSAAAAHTSSIDIGTDIIHVYARSPVTAGIAAATLDDLSNGRFILGIGPSNPTIARWHGQNFDRPLKRMEEYIEIVRRTFRREKVRFQGERYWVDDYRSGFSAKSDELRVYVAALGPRMTDLAARVGDGLMMNMPTVTHVSDQVARFKEAARKAGRDPEVLETIAIGACCVNADVDAAKEPMKTTSTFYGLADFYSDMYAAEGLEADLARMRSAYGDGGFRAAQAVVSDAVLDRLPAIAATDVKGVKARVAEYEDAGATRMILAYGPSREDGTAELLEFIEMW